MREMVRSVDSTRAVLKNGQAQVSVVNSADLVDRAAKRDQMKRLSEMMRQ